MTNNPCFSKIVELEEELRIVGNNMKSLEVSEQEVIIPIPAYWSEGIGHLALVNAVPKRAGRC